MCECEHCDASSSFSFTCAVGRQQRFPNSRACMYPRPCVCVCVLVCVRISCERHAHARPSRTDKDSHAHRKVGTRQFHALVELGGGADSVRPTRPQPCKSPVTNSSGNRNLRRCAAVDLRGSRTGLETIEGLAADLEGLVEFALDLAHHELSCRAQFDVKAELVFQLHPVRHLFVRKHQNLIRSACSDPHILTLCLHTHTDIRLAPTRICLHYHI